LHYRLALPRIACHVRDSFEHFLIGCTTSLRPRHGSMVIEALPKIASKAHALRALWLRVGYHFEPVYFGDDLTDEDAFNELGEQGISVLVGAPRRSAARYRVDTPTDVVGVLEGLAVILENVAQ